MSTSICISTGDLRDFLIENWFTNAADWVVDSAKDVYDWGKEKVTSAAKSVKDFAVASWDKAKKFGLAISQGDWTKVLSMIGRGVLWVLRKFKAAAYSTVGIIVDAILIATGVGKVAQAVFWGLVTGLDVYQLATGDWEPKGTPTWEKWLDLICDIIGLVGAGVAAKGARGLVKGIKSASQIPAIVKKNKAIMNIIKKMKSGASWVIGKITKALTSIKGKWSALDKFIDKIVSFCKKIFTGLSNFVKKVFPDPVKLTAKQKLSRGVKAGGAATGLMYGIDKYAEKKGKESSEKIDQAIDNIDLSSAEFDYDEI